MACVEMEVKTASGVKRRLQKIENGRDLFYLSKGIDQYRGFVVSDIEARVDEMHFAVGTVLRAGEACGDITERDIRRIHSDSRDDLGPSLTRKTAVRQRHQGAVAAFHRRGGQIL